MHGLARLCLYVEFLRFVRCLAAAFSPQSWSLVRRTWKPGCSVQISMASLDMEQADKIAPYRCLKHVSNRITITCLRTATMLEIRIKLDRHCPHNFAFHQQNTQVFVQHFVGKELAEISLGAAHCMAICKDGMVYGTISCCARPLPECILFMLLSTRRACSCAKI